MKAQQIIAATAAAIGVGGVASAESPSFRYCEAGYDHAQVDEAAQVSAGLTGGLLAAAEDGDGFRAACVWQVVGGLYLQGDVRQYDLDAVVASGFPGPILGPQARRDATAREWRAGLGYAVDVTPSAAVYGQVSYMRSDYYDDFAATDSTQLVVHDPGARDGVSLEAGARWRVVERLELAGYGRWDSEGAFGFESRDPETCCDLPGALIYEDGEVFRVGASAALRVAGPVWLTAGYEAGDIDSAFAGVRVAF